MFWAAKVLQKLKIAQQKQTSTDKPKDTIMQNGTVSASLFIYNFLTLNGKLSANANKLRSFTHTNLITSRQCLTAKTPLAQ